MELPQKSNREIYTEEEIFDMINDEDVDIGGNTYTKTDILEKFGDLYSVVESYQETEEGYECPICGEFYSIGYKSNCEALKDAFHCCQEEEENEEDV